MLNVDDTRVCIRKCKKLYCRYCAKRYLRLLRQKCEHILKCRCSTKLKVFSMMMHLLATFPQRIKRCFGMFWIIHQRAIVTKSSPPKRLVSFMSKMNTTCTIEALTRHNACRYVISVRVMCCYALAATVFFYHIEWTVKFVEATTDKCNDLGHRTWRSYNQIYTLQSLML